VPKPSIGVEVDGDTDLAPEAGAGSVASRSRSKAGGGEGEGEGGEFELQLHGQGGRAAAVEYSSGALDATGSSLDFSRTSEVEAAGGGAREGASSVARRYG